MSNPSPNDLVNKTQAVIDLLEKVGWDKGAYVKYAQKTVPLFLNLKDHGIDVETARDLVMRVPDEAKPVSYCLVGAAVHEKETNGLTFKWVEEFSSFLIAQGLVRPQSLSEFSEAREVIFRYNDSVAQNRDEVIETLRDFMSYLKGLSEETTKEM